MFCALNGATRTPARTSERASPATMVLFPESLVVPHTMRAPDRPCSGCVTPPKVPATGVKRFLSVRCGVDHWGRRSDERRTEPRNEQHSRYHGQHRRRNERSGGRERSGDVADKDGGRNLGEAGNTGVGEACSDVVHRSGHVQPFGATCGERLRKGEEHKRGIGGSQCGGEPERCGGPKPARGVVNKW